jgi:hypothetical protein
MRLPFLPIIICLTAGCAQQGPQIEIGDSWARATAPGQSSAAIYTTIANRGAADQLIGVSSGAGMAMLHQSSLEGGIARMRMVSAMDIAAGSRVALAPSGTHVMVTGLVAPLAVGADLRLTLRFAKAGSRTVKVVVVAAEAR